MKVKLAIFYGILIWALTYILSEILYPLFSNSFSDISIPIIMIIVTGFFGILYIRNIETNEVLEGILAGMIFVITDIICDNVFFVILPFNSLITSNYLFHILSMTVLTLLITTFLGYLAQMNIDLK